MQVASPDDDPARSNLAPFPRPVNGMEGSDSANETQLFVNSDGQQQSLISFYQSDTCVISVYYDCSSPPPEYIYVQHVGGGAEPINPGVWHQYTVGYGDCIMWKISDPATTFKLVWFYANGS
jgi:hypothetical protein